MKELFKTIGKDVYRAGRLGIYVFTAVVAVGTAWKFGNKVLDKLDKKLAK